MSAELSLVEVTALGECEQTIERGLATFVDVGRALLRIRDERLYRAEHGTFEAYCQGRWAFSRSRAYALIDAADAMSCMQDIPDVPPPTNVRQASELVRVPEADRPSVWREAVAATGGKPTAAAVRSIADRVRAGVEDELAARRGEIAAARDAAEQQRAEVSDFNAATAHLIPQAERERPWVQAALRLTYAIERLPLDVDPAALAVNVPARSTHLLDQLDDHVMAWLGRLFDAHQQKAKTS